MGPLALASMLLAQCQPDDTVLARILRVPDTGDRLYLEVRDQGHQAQVEIHGNAGGLSRSWPPGSQPVRLLSASLVLPGGASKTVLHGEEPAAIHAGASRTERQEKLDAGASFRIEVGCIPVDEAEPIRIRFRWAFFELRFEEEIPFHAPRDGICLGQTRFQLGPLEGRATFWTCPASVGSEAARLALCLRNATKRKVYWQERRARSVRWRVQYRPDPAHESDRGGDVPKGGGAGAAFRGHGSSDGRPSQALLDQWSLEPGETVRFALDRAGLEPGRVPVRWWFEARFIAPESQAPLKIPHPWRTTTLKFTWEAFWGVGVDQVGR